MRYAQIRDIDISNGDNIGVALFVQGCHFRCKNCFNPETWDFSKGEEWTEETQEKFIELAEKPFIKRISILGGEPLADKNLENVLNLVNKIRLSMPEKTIWIYSGYEWKQIKSNPIRSEIVSKCDVLVDGRYEENLKDITLRWRGSKNQRVIDVQQSIKDGKLRLYTQ